MKLSVIKGARYTPEMVVVDVSKDSSKSTAAVVLVDDNHADGFVPSGANPDVLTVAHMDKPVEPMRAVFAKWRNDPAEAWRFSTIADHIMREPGECF